MLKCVEDLCKKYEEKTYSSVLSDLGVTPGYDSSTDQYGNQQALNAAYDNIVWVYRCVNFIASNLARLEWQYFLGDTELEDTPIELSIMDKPNLYQTKRDFLFESYARLALQGEMFWELDKRGNQIVGIYADWRSEEVEVIPDAAKHIKGYKRMINGKIFNYNKEDVFYIWQLNPFNPIRGLSALRPSRHASKSDLNAVLYNEKFFEQGARPAGILTTAQQLGEPQAATLEKKIKRKYQNINQMHEFMVLWGDLKYQALNSMSMTDMQFKEGREMNREEIIAAFGLNLEVLGLGEKTYENVKFYRRLVWTETLIPEMAKISEMINTMFIPALTDKNITMKPNYSKIDALLEERSKKMGDYDKGEKAGAITPNEIRQDVFNKEPSTNPLMNLTSVERADLVPKEPKPKFISKNTFVKAFPNFLKVLTYEDRTLIWHKKIKEFDKYNSIFQAGMDKIFDAMVKDMKKQVPNLFPKSIKQDKVTGVIFDAEYWKNIIVEEMEPLTLQALSGAAKDVLDPLGVKFDPVHPQVRQMLGELMNNFSQFVSSTTDKQVKKLITIALQETAELPLKDKIRAIQAVLDEYGVLAKKNRSVLIARTESARAGNAGIQSALTQGKIPRKMWITSRDDRVRDTHQIDGEVVNADQSFSNGFDYPSDINERCIMIPTFEPLT